MTQAAKSRSGLALPLRFTLPIGVALVGVIAAAALLFDSGNPSAHSNSPTVQGDPSDLTMSQLVGDFVTGAAEAVAPLQAVPNLRIVAVGLASDGPAPPPPAPPPPPPPPTPASLEGLTIWGGGDSMSVFMNNYLMVAAAQKGMVPLHQCYDGTTKSQSCVTSSSLLTPGFFDWPGTLAAVAQNQQPDILVFMIGANDAWGYGGPLGSAEWRAALGAYVGSVMDSVVAEGRIVVWVGQPNARYVTDTSFDWKMATMNSVFAEQAAARDGVWFLDTYALFGGEDYWSYSGYRAGDGLHFTYGGGQLLGQAVFDLVQQILDERKAAHDAVTGQLADIPVH